MIYDETAPAFDLSNPKHRQMEADGVVENVLGSIIGSVRKELKDIAEGKKAKPPTAAGYAKIMRADLAARGFAVQPIAKKKGGK